MFPPLNLAAGKRSRGTLLNQVSGEVSGTGSDVWMTDMRLQSSEEMFWLGRMARSGTVRGAKPYVTVLLIMTLLLSVWSALCSA